MPINVPALRDALGRLHTEQADLGRMIEQFRGESEQLVSSGNNLIAELDRLKTAAETAQREKEAAVIILGEKEQQVKVKREDVKKADDEVKTLSKQLEINRDLITHPPLKNPGAKSPARSEQSHLLAGQQEDLPDLPTTQRALEEGYAAGVANQHMQKLTLDKAIEEKNSATRRLEEATKSCERAENAVSQIEAKLNTLLSQINSEISRRQQIRFSVSERYHRPAEEMDQVTVVIQKLQIFVANFLTPTSALFMPFAYHGTAAVPPSLLSAALCCGPLSMCLRALPEAMLDHGCVSQECVDCFGRIATKLEESKPFIAMAGSLLMLGGALTAPVLNPMAISAMILFTMLPMINKIFGQELTHFMGKDAYKATHAVLECVALSMFTHLTVQDMTEKPEMKHQLITLSGFFLNSAMTLLEIAARRYHEPRPPGAGDAPHPAPIPGEIQ